jgi:hypothetical protein
MMMKIRLLYFTIFVLFILPVCGTVYAENLTIQFHSNTVEQENCHTDFSLNGYITYDTVDAIKNGITAKLKVTFQLIRSEGLRGLGQNVLREKVQSLNISYDVWENSFIIEKEDTKSVHYVEKEGNIIHMVNEMISPIVIDVSSLNINEEVVLRAKIYIETIKLYPPFGIFLYFFDPWNYESDWIYSSSFSLKK